MDSVAQLVINENIKRPSYTVFGMDALCFLREYTLVTKYMLEHLKNDIAFKMINNGSDVEIIRCAKIKKNIFYIDDMMVVAKESVNPGYWKCEMN